MSDDATISLVLARLTCSECGITHGVPIQFRDGRQQDHRTFYCPNGHGQHFPQETEAERLRKKLHRAASPLPPPSKERESEQRGN